MERAIGEDDSKAQTHQRREKGTKSQPNSNKSSLSDFKEIDISRLEGDWMQIGEILGAHGVRGNIKVKSTSDFAERYEKPGQRWIVRRALGQSTPTEPKLYHLLAGRPGPGEKRYIVKLKEVSTREEAEALRGAWLVVPADDRPHLDPGEFHVSDIIGLDVLLISSSSGSDSDSGSASGSLQRIGRVTDMFTAGNDLLQVEMDDGRTFLVPFVEQLVPVVDLELKCLHIDPPPGLLPE